MKKGVYKDWPKGMGCGPRRRHFVALLTFSPNTSIVILKKLSIAGLNKILIDTRNYRIEREKNENINTTICYLVRGEKMQQYNNHKVPLKFEN